jgi:hypothetical protein
MNSERNEQRTQWTANTANGTVEKIVQNEMLQVLVNDIRRFRRNVKRLALMVGFRGNGMRRLFVVEAPKPAFDSGNVLFPLLPAGQLDRRGANRTKFLPRRLAFAGLGKLNPFGAAVFLAVEVVPAIREWLEVPEHIRSLVPPQKEGSFQLVLAVERDAVRVHQLQLYRWGGRVVA